jgi:hypothetical protein
LPDLAAIRAALAANLATVDGLEVSAYAMSNPTPPAAEIVPGETAFHLASQNGLESWGFVVSVFVPTAGGDIGSQQALDALAVQVRDALESDPTLAGAAQDVTVQSASGYSTYARESGGDVLGMRFQVEVYAEG